MSVTLLAGLGFGDEGKGTTIDHLARVEGAKAVVRYNGGAQAAHNVVTADGVHHTFAQFGSGTFAGAKTHLGPGMMVEPLALLREAEALSKKGVRDPLSLLTVDGRALLTTPYHAALNRLREISRGRGRHGSCGMGVGETMKLFLEHGDAVPVAEDLLRPARLRAKLEYLRQVERDEARYLPLPESDDVSRELGVLEDAEALEATLEVFTYLASQIRVVDPGYLGQVLQSGPVLFEGAQGVLLDQWHGFHPYTTWSDITFRNAERLLEEAEYTAEVKTLGVLRGYLTRHGAGPFPTEDAALTGQLPDLHNGPGRWQEHFRVGYLDCVLIRYALDVLAAQGSAVDGLVVTSLDRLVEHRGRPSWRDWPVCDSYHSDAADAGETPGVYENGHLVVGAPGDREHRQALADFVAHAKPEYRRVAEETYVDWLEARLGVPVVLESWGPKAEDKISRPAPTGERALRVHSTPAAGA